MRRERRGLFPGGVGHPIGAGRALAVAAALGATAAWPSPSHADALRGERWRALGEVQVGVKAAWGAGELQWGPEAIGMVFRDHVLDVHSGTSSGATERYALPAYGVAWWSAVGRSEPRWSTAEVFWARATLRVGTPPADEERAPTARISGGVLLADGRVGPVAGATLDAPVFFTPVPLGLQGPVVSVGLHVAGAPGDERMRALLVPNAGAGASWTVLQQR